MVLRTTVGDIDIELFAREASRASRRFVQLALEHYYDGAPFTRIVRDFIVQIGDADSSAHNNEDVDILAVSGLQPLKAEFHSRIRFVRRGLVATAFDFSPGASNHDGTSVAAQFFFTLSQTPELDRKHTIFGTVVGDTLYNMLKLNEIELADEGNPMKKHKINSIEVLSNPFEDIVPRPLALVRPDLHRAGQAAAEKAAGDANRGSKAVKNVKLLSFVDEVDDSEGEPAQQWASGARRAAASKSKSSHDLLEDPALARDPAYDIAALRKQESNLRDSTAASSAKGADDTKSAEQKGGPAVSGAVTGEELEGEEAAEAKRKAEERARIAQEISRLQQEIVSSKRAASKGSSNVDRQELEELEKKRQAASDRKLLLEDEYATLGGGRLGKLRSVSLARAAEALEEKEGAAKKGRADFAYVPGRYAGRGAPGSGGTGGSKQASSEREASTLELLKQFESQLQSATPSEGTDSEATWLGHRLEFEREPTKPTSEGVEEPETLPLDASALSGAQASEQFYALDDPRNPLNVRRREAGATAAGRALGANQEGERHEHAHSSKHSKLN